MRSNPNYSMSANTAATGRGPPLLKLVSPPPNHLPRLPTRSQDSPQCQPSCPVTLHSQGHRRRLEQRTQGRQSNHQNKTRAQKGYDDAGLSLRSSHRRPLAGRILAISPGPGTLQVDTKCWGQEGLAAL